MRTGLCIAAVLLAAAIHGAAAHEEDNAYDQDEHVILWLNKVGPYHNPQETYSYYKLPFCKPAHIEEQPVRKFPGIGEVLEGTEYHNSGILIEFGKDTPKTAICTQHVSDADAAALTYAVKQHYWYQMYFDDLPVWGMVGELVLPDGAAPAAADGADSVVAADADAAVVSDLAAGANAGGEEIFVYAHKAFSISRNGGHVIEVNLTSENPVRVNGGVDVEFTYSVTWSETDKLFKDRFNRYLDYSFFEHQIHWFSIFNSFMMVIFLCGLVALILVRTLKNDYAKYNIDESDLPTLSTGMDHDSGWKQVHGDVFRAPQFLSLYTALIATGYQLISLVLAVILLAILGKMYMDRGAITTAGITCYALTSIINGFMGGGFYHENKGSNATDNWKGAMLLSAALLPAFAFVVAMGLNCIAMYYGTINTIAFSTIVTMLMLWALVSLPLVVMGTFLGRHLNGTPNFPCRINVLPRPIPAKKWFHQPAVIVLFTGVLPFGSIFIEMYFIFTSFWNYKFYYVYGFMLLVYLILFIVTICVTVVGTYFLLNSEDWRWRWISFLSGGSTALYIFTYAVYYFFMKTNMTGFLQTCFYFGYMGMFSAAFFIMCGTIGSVGSSLFVKRIFRDVKID